jgi:hypothetical protein
MSSVFIFRLVCNVLGRLGMFVRFLGRKASLGRFITLDYFIILLLIHYLLIVNYFLFYFQYSKVHSPLNFNNILQNKIKVFYRF